ncbi:class I adenylate-forming enzyme family protein [Acidithrix ferrooxidans]|uniref:Long-chain-fatty-acid--CoA ligase n=1 Tax=Acidithrix ferrooxidans TaxID=1280514 RepID=A0A0D8HFJ9_9ACTN|nr:AMP-binding protein [Acidithrix ferrooxidans]KJF16654.1 long-chain-fatty-acid--CoA ligase [Acidithrix ferrooxidans]
MDDQASIACQITLNSLFSRSFRIFSKRRAITSESAAYTYGELAERSHRLASSLYCLGISKGDKVAILSETRSEYVETYCALSSLGVIALTINIRFHPDEIAYCLSTGAPKAIIVSGALIPSLLGFIDSNETTMVITYDGPTKGYLDYESMIAQENPPPPAIEITSSDIYNVLYTSGTTGRPKGAMISQGAAAIRAMRLAQWFSLTPDDGFVGWLPLFHCGGDESLYATLQSGGTYATLRKADARMMFKVIERDRLTWTLLLPGVITDFLHDPSRSDFDLSSLRFAIGYANMMPNIVTELTASANIDFYDAFGQTEASYLIAHGLSGPGETPSMNKIPAPLMEIRIANDDLSETPVGVPGECLVRGPSVMSGYMNDPLATAEAFSGGWLHTGDILVRNGDGSLTFVDRKKYLIKSGGENIYPAEVEQVIASMVEVEEVCVFGITNEHWGEAVSAVVVLRPGASLTKEEITNWCKERLGGYKRPREITFMRAEDLPRSTTGKLQRHLLSELTKRDETLK